MQTDTETLLALEELAGNWKAGPDLTPGTLRRLQGLRDAGMVERKFSDMGAPSVAGIADGVTINLRACWHFRLTPKGFRALAGQTDE